MVLRKRFYAALAVGGLVLAAAGGAGATGAINVLNPETRSSESVVVPPLLAPPGESGYLPVPANAPIAAPDRRPVAQLKEVPDDLANVAANFPFGVTVGDADRIAFRVLASVRYEGTAGRVLVTTADPSPAALERQLLLGSQTVQLADGSMAWITTGMPRPAPNRVVSVRDGLIITGAGDVPIERLQALVENIVVRFPQEAP